MRDRDAIAPLRAVAIQPNGTHGGTADTGMPDRTSVSSCCDAEDSVRQVTEFFRETSEFVEQDLSLELRRHVPVALLNLAVARLVAREGRGGAAAILAEVANAAVATNGADILRSVRFAGQNIHEKTSRPAPASSAEYSRWCGQ